MGCLRSDLKHRPNTLPGIVKQVRAKSSMPEVIVKDSLRRMIQVLICLLLVMVGWVGVFVVFLMQVVQPVFIGGTAISKAIIL